MRNLRLVQSGTPLEYPSTTADPTDRQPAIAPLDPEVRAMLDHLRTITPVPRRLRARVLARARAAIAAAARPPAADAKAPARRRTQTIY